MPSKNYRSLTRDDQSELLDSLYGNLKEAIKGLIGDEETISAANIILIIDQAMRLATKYPNLNGQDKKALVVKVISKLVDETNLKDQDRAVIKILVERTLDPLIDQIFAMAPGVYSNVKKRCVFLCGA